VTPRLPSPRGRARARGYTVVELLMSLTVLALGVAGILGMQRVTISSNRHARSLHVATRVAEAWADQLATDAMLWTFDSAGASTLGNTTWLKSADPTTPTGWYVPAWSAARMFGPAFDPLGNPIDPTARAKLGHFCAHIALTFMHSETVPTRGNGAVRAQIRVFWRRDDSATAPPGGDDLCSIDAAQFDSNQDSLHVVRLTTAVRQTPRGRL